MNRRPVLAAVAAAVALPVALAACGGNDAAGGTRAEAAATTTAPPPPAILTGLPSTDAGRHGRPALSVKIDNVPAARPQAGIDKADVVYEEMVEGGYTRFLAVFQSTDAESLGPVRSVRPVDAQIVAPLKGGFAYAGGIPSFVQLLRQTAVVDVGIDRLTAAYDRKRGRAAPHNLFTTTAALYEGVVGQPQPPPLFPFLADGQPFAPAGATDVARFTVTFGSQVRNSFSWDAARAGWLRSVNGQPHTIEGGGQLAPTTVIVQFTPYTATSQKDQSGSRVFTADTVGTGQAWIFADGKVLKGRWQRASQSEVMSYTDTAGRRVSIPPGRTWVLMPATGANVEVVAPPPPASTTTSGR